jgi:hypothetical protein
MLKVVLMVVIHDNLSPNIYYSNVDKLIASVVRVPGYRCGSSGSILGATAFSEK